MPSPALYTSQYLIIFPFPITLIACSGQGIVSVSYLSRPYTLHHSTTLLSPSISRYRSGLLSPSVKTSPFRVLLFPLNVRRLVPVDPESGMNLPSPDIVIL